MTSQLSNPSKSQAEALKSFEVSPEDKVAIHRRDADLVERSKGGEIEAFDELVTHYRGNVYAMFVNMIQSDADAEVLAQDVFVRAWVALPEFDTRSAFHTWIYRITLSVARDWLQKNKVPTGSDSRDAAEPDEKLDDRELNAGIGLAVKSLSEEHRAVVLLKEIDGLSYQEIADVMETSVGTVMSRLSLARKELRTFFENLDAPT